MTERLLGHRTTDDDRSMENVLRPQSFDDYVGQERMKESLRICIDAALILRSHRVIGKSRADLSDYFRRRGWRARARFAGSRCRSGSGRG